MPLVNPVTVVEVAGGLPVPRLAAEIVGALALLNALEQIELDEPKYFEAGYSDAA